MAWSKESRHKRGYGSAWDKTRLRILKRDHHLCQCDDCAKRSVPHIATEVDHIVSKKRAAKLGWTDDRIEADDNLQAINHECHKRKTAIEEGRAPRRSIGVDGWTIDG